MIIRRITLRLPAHMKATAAHDARALAEAIALSAKGNQSVTLPSLGQTAAPIAARLTQALKGGRHGG